MNDDQSKTWAEGVDSAVDHMKKMRAAVITENDRIVFVDVDYEIPLNQCATHSEIIRWVLHLDEKVWITKDLLTAFIVRAIEANNLKF